MSRRSKVTTTVTATDPSDPFKPGDAVPATPVPTYDPVFTKFKRDGGITQAEQSLIEQFIADQPRAVSDEQIKSLSKLLRRKPSTVRACIERARERFAEVAEGYVEVHQLATEGALNRHDYDTAAKHAEWALEHLSHEGQRVIDKDKAETHAPKILIGVNLGGMGLSIAEPAVTAEVIDANRDKPGQ